MTEEQRKMIFDRNVKFYREKAGLTQKELGLKMGKSESAISKWESGINSPKLEEIEQLAKVLDVEMDTLVYGKIKVSQDKLLEIDDVLDRNVAWQGNKLSEGAKKVVKDQLQSLLENGML
ncbi:helix-turn-helix domain-containing protein [Lactovum miscens]|uniref:Transcriptional regulator with XRE-family HTH domain n=1 Tax=Lactovum miscens TaxID=190387 RepID=A0A841C7K5_9LACT|nr:helix-turn-helix transcriptional regulator [Lactovum miscens]MBB5887718.1 transcriptional regulator with XRE-family HTH domain [Lactovum miscens]